MFAVCQATGRLAHRFDPATHRCKCGRWERGFKPKVEPARKRDECQICERKWALTESGLIGHHGYNRPGCGFIVGDCIGVGHAPYPATDALAKYLKMLEGMLIRNREYLAALPTIEKLHYTLPNKNAIAVNRGDEVKYIQIEMPNTFGGGTRKTSTTIPSFETLQHHKTVMTEDTIERLTHEIARVTKRIASAKV